MTSEMLKLDFLSYLYSPRKIYVSNFLNKSERFCKKYIYTMLLPYLWYLLTKVLKSDLSLTKNQHWCADKIHFDLVLVNFRNTTGRGSFRPIKVE